MKIKLFKAELTGLAMKNRYRIEWDEQMVEILKDQFSTTFNRRLAEKLGVSMRTLIRKARELELDKEDDFLIKRRKEITLLSIKAHPENPKKGVKGWSVPNSENTRFRKGIRNNLISNNRIESYLNNQRTMPLK